MNKKSVTTNHGARCWHPTSKRPFNSDAPRAADGEGDRLAIATHRQWRREWRAATTDGHRWGGY